MKTIHFNHVIRLYLLGLMLTAAPALTHAQEQSRRIAKSFNVTSNTSIRIDNRFGKVHVNTWDKEVVDLEVIVRANAKSESRTAEVLNQIRIDIGDKISSGSLSVSTDIGKIQGNVNFSIDYTLSVPRGNPLSLNNQFGNIYLQDYRGSLRLDLKYGQLVAGNLEGPAEIFLQFGKGLSEVQAFRRGMLDVKYSKVSIGDAGEMELRSQFSDVRIEKAQTFNIDAKYGSISAGEVSVFDGSMEFAGLQLDHLTRSLSLNIRHGNDIRLGRISAGVESIRLDSEFGSVDLLFEKGASGRFTIDTQFGSMKAEGAGISFNKITTDPKQSHYEGRFGSEPHRSVVTGNLRYGNLRLGYAD
jgi:hypothetical protein